MLVAASGVAWCHYAVVEDNGRAWSAAGSPSVIGEERPTNGSTIGTVAAGLGPGQMGGARQGRRH